MTSQNADAGFRDRFWRLSAVNILSNLMVPLAGLVDVAFLGHLSEIRHLAGVALATVLFNYLYWSFGFLRMGTTGMTAQAIGRQDSDEMLLVGLRNGALALAIGCVIVLLQRPLRDLGFALLSAAPDVKQSGQAYYDALIWGAPATLLNFVLIGWFLGREQGSKVLLLSAIGNLTNVVLNYWMIVRLGWESAGAGYASAIGQLCMALVGMGLVCREIRLSSVRAIAGRVLDPVALKATFLLNGDILVRTFALVSTFALFVNLSSTLGTLILATNTLLLQVVSFAAYFIDGIAFATESFAGFFQGQNQRQRLKALLRLAGSASLGLGLLFAIGFNLFPVALFRLLTNHAPVLAIIPQFVPWLFPVLGFGSIAYMLDGYFLGLTSGRVLRNAAILSTLVGFVPIAVIAWKLHSPHLLWLALSTFMLARGVALVSVGSVRF